jgi:hypothetical protein
MIKNVTIGSDPEFFISDGNRFIPSIGIIPGDKLEPFDMGNGFYIQKDNVLIEGNIPPARSKEEFVYNMKELKSLMNDYLRIVHPILHIVSGDSAEYNMEELKQYPEAMLFGCSSYLNAWTNTTTKAQSLAHSPWRTAGMHIHYGYDLNERFNKLEVNKLIVKAFDFFVTTQARKIYNDKIRSYYYGELGSYRNTSYGCEARSLGGYFTKDEFLPKVYDGAIQAIEYVNELLITNQTESLEKAMSINEIQYDRTPIFIF